MTTFRLFRGLCAPRPRGTHLLCTPVLLGFFGLPYRIARAETWSTGDLTRPGAARCYSTGRLKNHALDSQKPLVHLAERNLNVAQARVEPLQAVIHLRTENSHVAAQVIEAPVHVLDTVIEAADLREQKRGERQAGASNRADDPLRVGAHA